MGQLFKARNSSRLTDRASAQERRSSSPVRNSSLTHSAAAGEHVRVQSTMIPRSPVQAQRPEHDTLRRVQLNQYMELWEQDPHKYLEQAVRDARLDIVKTILDHGTREGEEQPIYSGEGSSLLRIAILNRDIKMTNLLKERGALVAKGNGETQLQVAAHAGDLKAMKSLLDTGAPLDCTDEYGFKPLHIVSMDSDRQNHIALLCSKGGNLEAKVSIPGKLNQFTPLQLACFGGQTQNVRALLCNGATPFVGSVVASRPLNLAVRYSHVATLRALLDHDPCQSSFRCRRTLSFLAGLAGDKQRKLYVDKEIIEILLEHQADPNAADAEANHVLHHLACRRWSDSVTTGLGLLPGKDVSRPFLDLGADINAVNRTGESPLYLAAHSFNVPLVKLLLGRGARGQIRMDVDSVIGFHGKENLTDKQLIKLNKMVLFLESQKCLDGKAGRCGALC